MPREALGPLRSEAEALRKRPKALTAPNTSSNRTESASPRAVLGSSCCCAFGAAGLKVLLMVIGSVKALKGLQLFEDPLARKDSLDSVGASAMWSLGFWCSGRRAILDFDLGHG